MAQLKSQSQFLEKPRIEELLQSKRDGVLCFTDGSRPYGVPLTYTHYDSGCLYCRWQYKSVPVSVFEKCTTPA